MLSSSSLFRCSRACRSWNRCINPIYFWARFRASLPRCSGYFLFGRVGAESPRHL
ncbi:F-box protein [Ralstonia pseudosolanacearum]|uniref:F-box protein n=1 Tax=Ralstonia pseudosolanacearum TaxID=1310165 RepID=UPI0038B633A8